MSPYENLLNAARRLPESDRLRLIDALWQTVSPEAEASFTEEWIQEIDRRINEIDNGTVTTIPWSTIRAEALARLGNAQAD